MKLDPREATRLGKIAGMLGSPHEGERAAAALKLTQLAKANSLDVAEVFARLARPEPARVMPVELRQPRPIHQDKADAVFASRLLISDWEREFLATIRTLPAISERQATVLARLYVNAVGAEHGRR